MESNKINEFYYIAQQVCNCKCYDMKENRYNDTVYSLFTTRFSLKSNLIAL